MALALLMSVAPAFMPSSGGTVTVTYSVTGEPTPITITGSAIVDGVTLSSTQVLGNTEQFNAPTAPGITFVATANPKVWNGTVA